MPHIELGGETVEIDADRDGLSLTSDALFMDGWWCLSWTDAPTLLLALTEALAWRMRETCSASSRDDEAPLPLKSASRNDDPEEI